MTQVELAKHSGWRRRTMLPLLRVFVMICVLSVLLPAASGVSGETTKEIYGIASRLSSNGSQLADIGTKIEKALSNAQEGSRERGYLMIAVYEIKNALLATGLSGQLIGSTQLVRQNEKKAYCQRMKGTLEGVSLSALDENKQFFETGIQRNMFGSSMQDCRKAVALIEDSMSQIRRAAILMD